MWGRRGKGTVVALALAMAATTAAPAQAARETATGSGVRAELSYWHGGGSEYDDLRVRVLRDGEPAFDRPVSFRPCDELECMPGNVWRRQRSIRLRDLDGDDEPEVVVDVYTGGAHCCSMSWILSWSDGRYVPLVGNWHHAGYRLVDRDGDGVPAFATVDGRFAYAFASFAGSRMPTQVVELRRGELVDVTRRHVALVRAQAVELRRSYQRIRGSIDAAGTLAAWAADQHVLGRGADAMRYVEAEERAGMLGAPAWSGRNPFSEVLAQRLRAWGYRR